MTSWEVFPRRAAGSAQLQALQVFFTFPLAGANFPRSGGRALRHRTLSPHGLMAIPARVDRG